MLLPTMAVSSPEGVRATGAGAPPFLDGEWTSGNDSFPSGNGSAGGDFRFRLNVLAGDATRNAVINALDLGDLKSRLNRTAANPGSGTGAYSVFADITGDGRINSLDLAGVKVRLNQRLPVLDPTFLLDRDAT